MALDSANALSGASLNALRRDAAGAPRDEATLRKVAQQFEALMTQQVLKASRAGALGEELVGGSGLDLYKDLFDQQMAQQISSGKGLGLADVLVQQLRGGPAPQRTPARLPMPVQTVTPTRTPTPAAMPAVSNASAPLAKAAVASTPSAASAISAAKPVAITDRISRFVSDIWQQAETTAKALGLPTEAVVGHAALETGWGRHQPAGDSHNLFGIKADKGWKGAAVTARTTEMDGGATRQEDAVFRAYQSPAEGFADYARFLKSNPRYAEALRSGSNTQFAEGLQKAGYATDPRYADKLKAAIARAAAARPAI